MTGEQLTMRLRTLLADLVGTYHDPDIGAAGDRPAVSYGDLPPSVTCTGLECHVDDVADLEALIAYQHEVGIGYAYTVRLVAHDGTPPGALQSAQRRVVATFRTPPPAQLPADERIGLLRQASVIVTG